MGGARATRAQHQYRGWAGQGRGGAWRGSIEAATLVDTEVYRVRERTHSSRGAVSRGSDKVERGTGRQRERDRGRQGTGRVSRLPLLPSCEVAISPSI